MTEATERLCREASARTLRWAAEAIKQTVDADPHFTALAWYKGLVCLNALGDADSAKDLLGRFERSGSRPGDFHPGQEMGLGQALTTFGAHQTWSNVFAVAVRKPLGLWRNYRNAWIACGAHQLGAAQLSEPALDLLTDRMSASLTAVPHNDLLDSGQRIYDIGTQASVAHAMLIAGRNEVAVRLGGFMRRVIMSQPVDAVRIYLALDAGAQPLSVTNSKLIRKQYWVELGAPEQVYWLLGFALKVFGMLRKTTGQSEWLDPAGRILAWLARCHPDYASNITCAKLSWGAAEMFAATGDHAWRNIAAKGISYVANTQNDEGVWIRPDYPPWLPQSLLTRLDTSVERMFYLQAVPRSLREGGQPLAE